MLACKIAWRYFFSKKSHGAVNIISAISVIGVAVATMAIVIVLSVFNGFTRLAETSLSVMDAPVKVSMARGKAIADADSVALALTGLPGVVSAMPVVEDRALAIYNGNQVPVIVKGLPDDYDREAEIADIMVDGAYTSSLYGVPAMQLGAGVAMKLEARPGLEKLLEIYVPRRHGRINPANPANSFRSEQAFVSGVFLVGQGQYDTEYVFMPLSVARDLLEYDTEATAIEVSVDGDDDVVARSIRSALGSDYVVETRMQQQQTSYRMIRIEKWVTFLMLAFILVIASFNIISTLSLMVIEKRANMQTMRALGARRSLVRSIFIWQGWLISVAGGVVGVMLGVALSAGQQHYGWVKLGADPSALVVPAYPVEVQATDIVVVLVLVMVIGLLTSQITRLFTRRF